MESTRKVHLRCTPSLTKAVAASASASIHSTCAGAAAGRRSEVHGPRLSCTYPQVGWRAADRVRPRHSPHTLSPRTSRRVMVAPTSASLPTLQRTPRATPTSRRAAVKEPPQSAQVARSHAHRRAGRCAAPDLPGRVVFLHDLDLLARLNHHVHGQVAVAHAVAALLQRAGDGLQHGGDLGQPTHHADHQGSSTRTQRQVTCGSSCLQHSERRGAPHQ